jgi:hypothetical protein
MRLVALTAAILLTGAASAWAQGNCAWKQQTAQVASASSAQGQSGQVYLPNAQDGAQQGG